MIDLRDYGVQIRQLVAAENEKDENWKWSVKSISKNRVSISWGYLDYIGEKNTFSITANEYPDDEFLGNNVVYRHPSGDMISFRTVGNKPGDTDGTIEGAITAAFKGIAYYAHSRY